MSYELRVLFTEPSQREEVASELLDLGFSPNGDERSFRIERGRELFVAAYIEIEKAPKHVSIVWAFGGSVEEAETSVEVAREIASRVGGRVFDPQLGRITDDAREVLRSWGRSDLQALKMYASGKYVLRELIELNGKRVMLEAQEVACPTATNFAAIGVAYAHAGELKRASSMFDMALALDPQNPDILYAQGLTYFNLGKRWHATKYLERALASNPDHEQAAALLGEVR